MGWDALLRGVQAGIENYTNKQKMAADEEQRKKDEDYRQQQLQMLRDQLQMQKDAADREAASWEPGTPETPAVPGSPVPDVPSSGSLTSPTQAPDYVAGKPAVPGKPAGINYQKALSDLSMSKKQQALIDAQIANLDKKAEPTGNETIRAYNEDIRVYDVDANGNIVRRPQSAIDADISRAYGRWLSAQGNGNGPSTSDIFDAKGNIDRQKLWVAIGNQAGTQDLTTWIKAGMTDQDPTNLSKLDERVNNIKNNLMLFYGGADPMKQAAVANAVDSMFGGLGYRNPNARAAAKATADKAAADKAAADRVAAEKADAAQRSAQAAKDQAKGDIAAQGPVTGGLGEKLANSPDLKQLPEGIDVNSEEPNVWRLAKKLQQLKDLSVQESADVQNIITEVEKPGMAQSLPSLINKLMQIAKRHGIQQ